MIGAMASPGPSGLFCTPTRLLHNCPNYHNVAQCMLGVHSSISLRPVLAGQTKNMGRVVFSIVAPTCKLASFLLVNQQFPSKIFQISGLCDQ